MLHTPQARRGMVTSPHHLASAAGLRVLREGGNAIEATLAMGAMLAVVYPHMNALGGDGFWLIHRPDQDPIAIDACGGAAHSATPELYHQNGYQSVPWRGPLAANTVAGTLSGWAEAKKLSEEWGGTLSFQQILEDAIDSADNGFPVTASQHALTTEKLSELINQPNFAHTFLIAGKPPLQGTMMKLPLLAKTLKMIAERGPLDFYHGDLAHRVARDLQAIGAPVTRDDLERHRAARKKPLSVKVSGARLFNFPPPTQGLSSLMILAIFDRLKAKQPESFEHIHGLIEATKQAFLIRDRVIGDPSCMDKDAQSFLHADMLQSCANHIDPQKALPWPYTADKGDTVWLGAIDQNGIAASFIQSIYFEYGSGCVLPETGILWQNRGASFQLQGTGHRLIGPGRKPFHTLNPAMALFDDGRCMVYGTMGGEGQPQTQSAIFSRYGFFNQSLQASITAPRWLLGKTWGENSVTLKLENRFDPALIKALKEAGHDVEILSDFTATMGHAGAVVKHQNGLFEAATDPRSDGAALGF